MEASRNLHFLVVLALVASSLILSRAYEDQAEISIKQRGGCLHNEDCAFFNCPRPTDSQVCIAGHCKCVPHEVEVFEQQCVNKEDCASFQCPSPIEGKICENGHCECVPIEAEVFEQGGGCLNKEDCAFFNCPNPTDNKLCISGHCKCVPS